MNPTSESTCVCADCGAESREFRTASLQRCRQCDSAVVVGFEIADRSVRISIVPVSDQGSIADERQFQMVRKWVRESAPPDMRLLLDLEMLGKEARVTGQDENFFHQFTYVMLECVKRGISGAVLTMHPTAVLDWEAARLTKIATVFIDRGQAEAWLLAGAADA